MYFWWYCKVFSMRLHYVVVLPFRSLSAYCCLTGCRLCRALPAHSMSWSSCDVYVAGMDWQWAKTHVTWSCSHWHHHHCHHHQADPRPLWDHVTYHCLCVDKTNVHMQNLLYSRVLTCPSRIPCYGVALTMSSVGRLDRTLISTGHYVRAWARGLSAGLAQLVQPTT